MGLVCPRGRFVKGPWLAVVGHAWLLGPCQPDAPRHAPCDPPYGNRGRGEVEKYQVAQAAGTGSLFRARPRYNEIMGTEKPKDGGLSGLRAGWAGSRRDGRGCAGRACLKGGDFNMLARFLGGPRDPAVAAAVSRQWRRKPKFGLAGPFRARYGSESEAAMLLLTFCCVCERPLFTARPTRKYCGGACRQRRYRARRRARREARQAAIDPASAATWWRLLSA